MIARLRTGLAFFAVIALLCQGLIPAGMMPDLAGHDGHFKLTICSGMGLRTISVPADYDPLAPPAPAPVHGKTPPCPYAMASLISLALALVILMGGIPPPARHIPHREIRFPPSLRFFGNAGPRAPPVFSAN